jgi:hypothetical protein
MSASQTAPISVDDDDDELTSFKTEPTNHGYHQSYGNGHSMQVDDDETGGAEFYDADNGYISDGDVV